jgi:alkaline phosphatase D
MDQWPGYTQERMELMRFLADRKVPNPVVLTGDIHSNWCNDLRVDDRKPEQAIVAAEFVGTSISSGGNGSTDPKPIEKLLADNPCVRFHNRQRGYVRCDVTPKAWLADYVVLDQVLTPGGKSSVAARFAIEAGKPGVAPA